MTRAVPAPLLLLMVASCASSGPAQRAAVNPASAAGTPSAAALTVGSPTPAPASSAVTPVKFSHAPISSRDRVYTGNQTSNTVSVIDPSADNGGKLLGEIVLGAPRTEVLSPIYRRQLNVHGLGFSPDHRTLVVVSVGSNSVTFVDTSTNQVKATTYIGRAPHEAFFTPDGREVWVTVRGQDYVSVLDAVSFRETAQIRVADGPGMLLFRPDGRVAFVVSSFTPEVDVIDVPTKSIVARVPVVSPFSPNLAVSADGQEMWMTHKDVGKVTRIDAQSFKVRDVLDTGPITNHVALVDLGEKHLAFVTVGGLNQVKVFTRDATPALVATIPTGALPHGIWPSDDQSRVYVGLENGDEVSVIDVATLKELSRIPIGQAPQALVYVSDAAPAADAPHLTPLGEAQRPVEITLKAPAGKAGGLIVIRGLGLIDTVDVNLFGLASERTYTVTLVAGSKRTLLAVLETNARGGGAVQVTGPVRRASSSSAPKDATPRRIVVAEDRAGAPEELSTTLP